MVDALIIDACRTPRGIGKAGKGALSGIHPQQLGATVLRALADRSPNFRIAGGQSRRRTELAFHGLAELRLVLEPTLV